MERYRTPVLRHRFAVARGALRMLLAKYLGRDPAHLDIAYEPQGKPFLRNPPSNLRFNLSHSGDLLAIAVCLDWAIGVDIEKENPQFPVREVAARFFCKSEQQTLTQVPEQLRLPTFFQIWTAKEAVLKASAFGLSLEPCKVQFALCPLRLMANKECEKAGIGRWHLIALTPGTSYRGALAVAEEPSQLLCHDLRTTLAQLETSRPAGWRAA